MMPTVYCIPAPNDKHCAAEISKQPPRLHGGRIRSGGAQFGRITRHGFVACMRGQRQMSSATGNNTLACFLGIYQSPSR